ncbi:MAG: mechanosensitive ion channel family protein [Gammaproteobacteria bacterium]
MESLSSLYDALPDFIRASIPTIILLVGGSLGIAVIQRLVRQSLARLQRRIPLSLDTVLVLQRLSAGVLWTVLLLFLLHLWGINVSGLWAMLVSVLAVIGVGLLAVWTMISNITASLFIWIWRPYELGQQIEILPEGFKGRAVDRNMMFTEVREDDGNILAIPNNLFFQRIIRRSPDGSQEPIEQWEARTRR